MSTATHQQTSPGAAFAPPAGDERRQTKRRRVGAIMAVLVVVGAVVAVVVADPFAGRGGAPGGLADNADPTSVTTVTQGDLTQQTQVSATLGYSGTYDVVNQAQGTLTSLPSIGQVVSEGQVLYDVNGSPVVLLYGTTPAYRTLAGGRDGLGHQRCRRREPQLRPRRLGLPLRCRQRVGPQRLHRRTPRKGSRSSRRRSASPRTGP